MGQPRQAHADADEDAVKELRQSVRELQQQLKSRDATIAELLRRIDALERQLDARETGPAAPSAAPAPATIAPSKDAEDEPKQAADSSTPAPEPGQLEVDEEAVTTALERALVQEGALVLPSGTVQLEPNMTFVRRSAGAPSLASLQGGQDVVVRDIRRNELSAGVGLRLGLPFEAQMAVDIPYRSASASTVTRSGFVAIGEEDQRASGLGDIAVSFSKRLSSERGWQPDLFLGLLWDSDSGEINDGVNLGSGFNEYVASLTAVKSQDPLVFLGSLSYTWAREHGGVRPGEAIGASFGAVLAASPETSLRFVLKQSFADNVEIEGNEITGPESVVALLSIGGSSILSPRSFLDFELSIGITDEAPDYSVAISLPIRF